MSPDIFETAYYFLHKSAFGSHETNESDQQNRIVLKHSLDQFKVPSTQIQIKMCGSKNIQILVYMA